MPDTIAQDVTQTAASIQTAATSFWNSPALHNHIRTWTIVIVALFAIGFIFVHESNSNAVANANATLIVQQGAQQQAALKEQIAAVNESTKQQVAVVTAQMQQNQQQNQTVLQTLAMIKSSAPPSTPGLNIQPIVVPSTIPGVAPTTTANDKAIGDLPVATISGDGLKQLAANNLSCQKQAIVLDGCQKDYALEQKTNVSLTNENKALKKIKIEPAWKKTLKKVGLVAGAIGIAILAHSL
jgi:hypothetical protein